MFFLFSFQNAFYKASDFIIADAKDADMAAGIRAPGYIRENNGTLTNKTASYEHYLKKWNL